MAEEPAAVVQLLRLQKAKLIEILRADADFVLQHADSRCLLSEHGYQHVKHCRIPSVKVTELLDHVIQRGPGAAQGLLDLLKEPDLQKTFPMLDFVKDLHVNTVSSGTKKDVFLIVFLLLNFQHYHRLINGILNLSFFFHIQEKKETSAKRTEVSELPDVVPTKKSCGNGESGSV